MILQNKINHPKELLKKMMDKIIQPEDHKNANPCWEWIGRIDNFDRPLFRLNFVYVKARIVVYECFYGSLEENQTLLPTCHTQNCVNPTHLTLDEFSFWRKKIVDLPNEVQKIKVNLVLRDKLQSL